MTTDSPVPADLHAAFAELGQVVLGEQPLSDVLQKVADVALRTVPGADDISVTLVNGKPYTAAFTGEMSLELDERQYEAGHGPCLAAAEAAATLLVADVANETRWPEFIAAAAARGAGSVLSVGMPVQQRTLGALNVYSCTANAFDEAGVAAVQTFARYAAVALANASLYQAAVDLAQQMREAMEGRAAIEQAKGIIMMQRRCSADAAFDVLVEESQRRHRKLRDLAVTIVHGVQRAGDGPGDLS